MEDSVEGKCSEVFFKMTISSEIPNFIIVEKIIGSNMTRE
jgi:hypothetical protein